MKKIACILLCALLMLCLAACPNSKEPDEGFTELAALLLERGVGVCEKIYLGNGLPADIPDGAVLDYENGSYYPVTGEYTSIAALKAEAEAAFTPELAETWLYAEVFEGDRPLYKEIDGVLCVDVTGGRNSAFGVEWFYDTLTVTEQSDTVASAVIETAVSDQKGFSSTVLYEHTENGWRISSQLYGAE